MKFTISVEIYIKVHPGKLLSVFSKSWSLKKLRNAIAVDFVGDISGLQALTMFGPKINMTSGGVSVYGCMLDWRLFRVKSTG
jgi:hypothetical protein